jgi:hypothetical protein
MLERVDHSSLFAVILGASRSNDANEVSEDAKLGLPGRLSATAQRFAEFLSHPTGLGLPETSILNLFDDAASPTEQRTLISKRIDAHRRSIRAHSRPFVILIFVGHAVSPNEQTCPRHFVLRSSRRSDPNSFLDPLSVSGHLV